jgi:malate/lactate dehydrogenase
VVITAGMNEKAGGATDSNDAQRGLTLLLPSVVGRAGVKVVLLPEMSDDEARALDRSAGALREAATPQFLVGARR